MFDKFKNSIVGKIMLGYAAIILLAFITTLVSMYSAWQNRKIDQLVSEAYYPMVLTLKETELMASESYKLTNNWIYQPSFSEKEKLQNLHSKEVAVQKEKLAAITNKFDQSVANEGKAITQAFDALLASQKLVMTTLYHDSTYSNDVAVDEAITAMDSKITPAFKGFNELIAQVTIHINQLLDEAKADKEASSRILSILYISNMVLFVAIGIYAMYFSRTFITKPIAGLSELITTLSKGKFVSVTLKKGRDEIGRMAEAIESMLTGLKGKVEFAENIGKGNYDSNFEQLSEDDTMGEALIRMRDNLKQAADEDRKRNWATEGHARFAEILRSRNDDMSQLADNIISNLVKYMNASQGALFLVNDDDQRDVHIELVACYAYNRKKFLNKRIELGEGITGQSILERDTIYMSDVPDDYLKITSGLGEALPKNLLVVPLKLNENIFGVLEIASFQIIEPYQVEFVEKLGESIASTISSAKVNGRTKKLLEETQVQAEQMRAQEEEMRQNMEELSATQEEMQRVMREVQTKEQFTTELLNVSTDMIVTIDYEYKIVNFNKAFERAVGNEFRVAKGADMLTLLPESQRAERIQVYKRVLAGESIEQNETHTLGGREIHLTTSQVPLRDAHGNITGVAIFTKDITDITIAKNDAERIASESQQQSEELKAQEEELRQNMEELAATQEEVQRILNETQNKERYLSELINVSKDAIFTIDHNYKITNFNDYFAFRLEKMGVKVSVGFNILDLFKGDEKLVHKANYDKVLAGQTIEYADESVINGHPIYLTSTYAPMRNTMGEVIGMAGFTKDITELKNAQHSAEKLNRELGEREEVFTLTTILSEADVHGTITFVNDKLCHVSKFKREELIGKPHNIFRHEDMPAELFKKFWQTIKKGNVFRGVIKNKAKDGSAYWVDATIMPVKNEKGEIVKFIGARYHIEDEVLAVMLYNRQAEKMKLPALELID